MLIKETIISHPWEENSEPFSLLSALCCANTRAYMNIYLSMYLSVYFQWPKGNAGVLSPELMAEKLQFCFCECIAMVCGQTPVTFSCVSESTFLLKYSKRVPRNGWHCVGLGTEGIALLQMLQLLTENLGASVLWLSISFLGVLISKIMFITLSKKGWLHNSPVSFQRQQLNANF